MNIEPTSADSFCEQGERHLKNGASLLAYDVLADGVRQYPTDVRLRQRLALAMARAGASRDANVLLTRLAAEGHADEETVGLLARTHKDLALTEGDPDIRRAHLRLAFHRYTDAFRQSGGYWTGINAATMAVLLDERDDARVLAADVRARCLALRQNGAAPDDPYWLLATLGEAALVLGDIAEAEDWYTQAAAVAAGRHADLTATRRNARLILNHLQADAARIEACFVVPPVVVFAGHLIDRPGRQTPRFPHAVERDVARALDACLASLKPDYGFASAACGGDLLFLESLARAGGAAHVVLPYNREQFRIDSVDVVPGADWSDRFERALDRAAEITIASEHPIGGGLSFEYGFRLLDGSARVKADELETDLVCVALWDGGSGDGRGGTASAVEHWRRAGRRIEMIDLAALRGVVPEVAPRASTVQPEPSAPFPTEIVGLLFADAKGFSRLTEPEIPLFVEHFLGTIAKVLARAPVPLQLNTWGDGLYLVFDSVAATGQVALALSDSIRAIDWQALGFAEDLSVRIGLHAGPAYVCTDPVTGRPNYLGAHVSRAARIEPVAPPGEVYASGAFAALARADQVDAFTCAYVGQTPLAKGYGTFPTYLVRRQYRSIP